MADDIDALIVLGEELATLRKLKTKIAKVLKNSKSDPNVFPHVVEISRLVEARIIVNRKKFTELTNPIFEEQDNGRKFQPK